MADSSELDSTVLTSTERSATFSTTLDSSQSQGISRALDITRDELERRQLVHTIQLLKLEVSQKQLMLETVRNEQASQVEELSERLSDTLHEKKLVTLRLQSLTHAYEQEVGSLRGRVRQLQSGTLDRPVVAATMETSSDLRQEVEQALMSPHLTETDYEKLRTTVSSDLPVQDLIKLRVFELTNHLERKCAGLEETVSHLNQRVIARQQELEECQQGESHWREGTAGLEEECSRLRLELSQVKVHVQEGNYKIDNYDVIKRERDELRDEVCGLKQRQTELEARGTMGREELDKLTKELSHSQQAEHLLQQDKEYLGRQLTDLTHRASQAEDRADSLAMELTHAKKDRESVYEQLLKSREDHRVEYESRLQRELETLRARTALEMDQIRTQSAEISEREHRTLRESTDNAFADRDGAVARENETNSKYEQLLREHHGLQATSERRVCELQAKLQVIQFERERAGIVSEETTRQLSEGQLEREKLQKKVDLLNQELWRCQTEREAERRCLETKVEDQRLRLEGYERVERDMDDIVMQAAQVEHECDAERVLFSYGFGTGLPTTSKRRLQQSVHLARRVLHLEKVNTSLNKDLEDHQDNVKKLREQVCVQEDLLEQSKQPYSYLIETIRGRDRELEGQRDEVAQLQREIAALKSERQKMVNVKNQMSLDLEKLLSHREELHQMRQLLSRLVPHGVHMASRPSPAPEPALETDQPPPTLFTKQQKRSRKRSSNITS